MTISIERLDGGLGIAVRGVDLSAPLDTTTFRQIERAWLDQGVVLFRGQRLDDGALVDFSRRFGELEPNPASELQAPGAGHLPYVWIISNVVEDGEPLGSLGAGEAEWHTDMSYIEEPPKASALYAIEVTAQGGDTWFLDMRAAYASLPRDIRQAIEGRRVNHSASLTSVGGLRKGAAAPTDVTKESGAKHPIVRTHPETGAQALYLGRRSWAYIEGMSAADSEVFLDRLWALCVQPRFMTRHSWQVGDLIVWDNRRVMHRRDAFDPSERRIMHRTQIKGDRPN